MLQLFLQQAPRPADAGLGRPQAEIENFSDLVVRLPLNIPQYDRHPVFRWQGLNGLRDHPAPLVLDQLLIRSSAVVGGLKFGLVIVFRLEQTGQREYRPTFSLSQLADSQVG